MLCSDVKPDNVMVDFHGSGSELVVEKAQLTDLENAAYLPKGRCIKGMLPGNDNWRSPEGHLLLWSHGKPYFRPGSMAALTVECSAYTLYLVVSSLGQMTT
jgi:serine/threonine protein kinase